MHNVGASGEASSSNEHPCASPTAVTSPKRDSALKAPADAPPEAALMLKESSPPRAASATVDVPASLTAFVSNDERLCASQTVAIITDGDSLLKALVDAPPAASITKNGDDALKSSADAPPAAPVMLDESSTPAVPASEMGTSDTKSISSPPCSPVRHGDKVNAAIIGCDSSGQNVLRCVLFMHAHGTHAHGTQSQSF